MPNNYVCGGVQECAMKSFDTEQGNDGQLLIYSKNVFMILKNVKEVSKL